MKDKMIFYFPVKWAVSTIWQGCQVKGQVIVEHSLINGYYAFLALVSLGLITSISQNL
jgi:hypothetical protein